MIPLRHIVLFLLAWIPHNAASFVLISPDGHTFPRAINLMHFEYELKGWNLLRRHEKQSRAIESDISSLIHDQKDFYYNCMISGEVGWMLPILSPGFRSGFTVSFQAKTEPEFETMLANKVELREQLKKQIMDLFENTLQKKYKKLHLVSPPSKPQSITFDLKLSGNGNVPTHEQRKSDCKLSDDDPLSYAEELIDRAIRHHAKQKGMLEFGGGYSGPVDKTTRGVCRHYDGGRDTEDIDEQKAIGIHAILAFAEENKWVNVTLRPDLDE